MTGMLTLRICIITSCCLYICTGNARVVIPGNQTNPSFSFPIQTSITSALSHFYTGSAQTGAQEFTIAGLAKQQDTFFGLTPKIVTLDGEKEQANPLFNVSISQLALIESGTIDMAEHLIAVSNAHPASLYVFENKNNDLRSIATTPDAKGATTSGIVAVTTNTQGYVFAATKAADGSPFGNGDSGVALALFAKFAPDQTAKTDPKSTPTPSRQNFILIDTITGTIKNPRPLALPLNTATIPLKIGNSDLAAIHGDIVTMHWNKQINRLFIGLQITTGATGGRALLIGKLVNNKLVFDKIAPDTVFDAINNKIIGTLNGNADFSIHQVSSLLTSTSLNYLIIQGGFGPPNTTLNNIYALPLINQNQDTSLIGTIAALDAPVHHIIQAGVKNALQNPATTPEQMTTDMLPAAQIGGGVLNPAWGVIKKIITKNDAVFAIVDNNDGNGGIFFSQALFDQTGKIKRWTNWQRYAGVINNVTDMFINSDTQEVVTLVNTMTDATVYRTQWSPGEPSLSAPLIGTIGPVAYLQDFPFSTPGFNDISAITSAYNNQITLAQTGTIIDNNLSSPLLNGSFAHKKFNNGQITENLGADTLSTVITLSGGALNEINPITQVIFAYSPTINQGWIFSGGDKGLAFLANTDNTGWSSLGNGFQGLTNGMSFKKLGDYSYIKKLIADNNYLYVLTDTILDRIELNPSTFQATRLAQAGEFPFISNALFFNDLIVSDKLGLLATQNGLFRVGDGQNIMTAPDQQTLNWTMIPIPNNITGPITHLYAFSSTGQPQDSAKENSDGHLYVLSADRSKNNGQINRFTINPVSHNSISSDTILPLPDFTQQTTTKPPVAILSYWANLGEFRDLFATDGATYFHARSQETLIVSNLKNIYSILPINTGINKGKDIPAMIRNSALGTWLIGNESGIYTNE